MMFMMRKMMNGLQKLEVLDTIVHALYHLIILMYIHLINDFSMYT